MPSSTQFSIRALMAITVVVAVISASVAPMFRQLEPQHWPRAFFYLSLQAAVVGAVAGGSCLRRRRIEKKAGRLLSRTEIGGKPLRWASLIAVIPLSAMAAGMALLLATAGPPVVHLLQSGIMLPVLVALFGLSAGFAAAGLFLHWWWGTGFLTTEAFQNGLVVRGLVFKPWSELVSYQRATLFIVNVSTPRGTCPIRICVAVKDRAEWEHIFSEHGVPPTGSLVENDEASPTEPTA